MKKIKKDNLLNTTALNCGLTDGLSRLGRRGRAAYVNPLAKVLGQRYE